MADISKPLNITATPPPVTVPSNPLENVGITSGELSVSLPQTSTVSGNADVTTIAIAIRGMGEENIPDPRLFKFLADKYGVSEVALLKAYKNVPELLKATDARTLAIKKLLLEVVAAREEFRKSIRTGRQDSFTKQETISLTAHKSVQDVTGRAADAVLNKHAVKGVTELKQVQEVFSKRIAIVLAEIDYWLQDYNTSSYTERAVHLGDVLNRTVQYNRSLHSIADATDDFYGTANLDDDQLAAFGKTLVDYSNLVETFTTSSSYIRSYSSAGDVGDQVQLGTGKLITSSTDASDTVSWQAQFLRNFNSSSNTSEVKLLLAGKVLLDTADASDSVTTQTAFKRSLASQSILAETSKFWSQIRLLEIKNILDTSIFRLSKYLQDSTTTQQNLQLNVQNYSLERYAAVGYVGQNFVY